MPTNSPATMMMMSDITPVENNSLMTRWKRRKLLPECVNVSMKKRVATPMRHTILTARWPIPLIALTAGIVSAPQIQVLTVITAGIMEGHRTIHLAMHELVHKILARCADLVGRPLRLNHAIGHEINVVHNLQRLLYIVRHHYRGRTQRVMQAADQIADHRQRNRIQPGKWLVIHD